MYSLDASTIKNWLTIEDRWFPKAISANCPACTERVIFATIDQVYDSTRDTIAASAQCPSCDSIVAVWGIHPYPSTPQGQKGCERIVMYPEPPQRLPIAGLDVVPERIRKAYTDTLSTYNSGVWSTTAVSCRRTLEGIVSYMLAGTNAKGTLANQIKQLSTTGSLSQTLINLVDALREGGNIGAHFDQQRDADQETAEAMLDLIEYMLEYVYILPGMVDQLSQRIDNLGKPKPQPPPLPPPIRPAAVTTEPSDSSVESSLLRYQFWQQLLPRAKAAGVMTHSRISPTKDHWLSASTGRSGLSYNYLILKDSAAVELWIATRDKDENKQLYDSLATQRTEIERVLGGSMAWERLDDKQSSRIRYTLATNGLRAAQSEWPSIQDAMITAMNRLAKAFGPHIQALPKHK